MKQITLLMAIWILSGFSILNAGDLDFQLGGGYNGYFTSGEEHHPDFPAGFALFGGIGYAFQPGMSAGAEYEFARDWSFDEDPAGYNVAINQHIPKVYFKFDALNLLTVTALAGIDMENIIIEKESLTRRSGFTTGVRLNVLFAYFQYMMVFQDGMNHRIGAGFVFNR